MTSRTPRVLVIPPSYFDRDRTVGGGERYAHEYARALAELTPTTLGLFDTAPCVETDGPLTIRVFPVRHLKQRLGFPATARAIRELDRFDVLHVMVFPTPLTDLLILLGRFRHRRVVLTDIGGGGACWSTRLARVSARLDLNRWADGLAHLSHYAGTPYANWRCPQVTLHGGVRAADAKDRAEAEPGGYALFVGRLLPHKGVLELVRAVGQDTPLRVVGRVYDRDYFARLQAVADGKRVTFHTDTNDTELAGHYRRASVVVQPSLPSPAGGFDRAELLGLVALEGMSWGKPVVVTRTASLIETILDGVTGRVVPPHDAAALREAVEGFVAKPALSRQVGESARRHVLANFTWEQAAHRGLDFYHRVLGAQTPPSQMTEV
ncbi:MAG: glycosyltransferase family 4 protein [Singulisphaera sp.]|nr:glycosyltransferase family 4 protein [Planctomycetaceae bacterium]MBV8608263.1 glycosyltransferase family 4 protein [Singulisphaera sp.]